MLSKAVENNARVETGVSRKKNNKVINDKKETEKVTMDRWQSCD